MRGTCLRPWNHTIVVNRALSSFHRSAHTRDNYRLSTSLQCTQYYSTIIPSQHSFSRMLIHFSQSRSCASQKNSVLSKENIKQQSHTQLNRLKELWRKYGLVAIATYFTLYGVVLGSIYVSIAGGYIPKRRLLSPSDGENGSGFDVVTTTNKYVKVLCMKTRANTQR